MNCELEKMKERERKRDLDITGDQLNGKQNQQQQLLSTRIFMLSSPSAIKHFDTAVVVVTAVVIAAVVALITAVIALITAVVAFIAVGAVVAVVDVVAVVANVAAVAIVAASGSLKYHYVKASTFTAAAISYVRGRTFDHRTLRNGH